MRHIYFLFLCFSVHLGVSTAQPLEAEIKFWPEQSVVILEEPIVIEFSTTNHTVSPLQWDLGLNREGAFQFDISAPDGTSARVSAPVILQGPETVVRIATFAVDPGQTYKQRIHLGQWYRFTLVGSYVVTGRIVLANNTSLSAPAFTITMTAADPKRLATRCEELLRTAMDMNDKGSFDAAFDLGLIKDPIAIPYLEQMLKGWPPVRATAIEALSRFDTTQAVDALVNFLNTAEEDDRNAVLGRLRLLSSSTHNAAVRERILTSISKTRN